MGREVGGLRVVPPRVVQGVGGLVGLSHERHLVTIGPFQIALRNVHRRCTQVAEALAGPE